MPRPDSHLDGPWVYAEHDLPPPKENSDTIPTNDEETELRQIAGALTVAAAASGIMSTAVLVATLLKVSKKPSLFFTRELPAPVEWAIACDTSAATSLREPWRDIWGDQVALLPGQVEHPSKRASRRQRHVLSSRCRMGARAAGLTIVLIKFLQPIGRDFSPERAADSPAPGAGDAPRQVVYMEGGPIYDFLELVLKPLQRHLRDRGLAPVTVATIVRFVTDDFPKT